MIKSFFKTIDLSQACIISTVFHLIFIVSMNSNFPNIFKIMDLQEQKLTEIEFEFVQAQPRAEKKISIPVGFINSSLLDSHDIITTKQLDGDYISALNKPKGLDIPFEDLPNEELIPSLEEQTEIKQTTEKTSDSLASEMDLKELEKNDKIKWDYSNRISSLIETHSSLPKSLKEKGLSDVVVVKISLNRDGKLINGTPLILPDDLSKYPEINIEAVRAVKKAANFFPKLPENYTKKEITFWLPIKYKPNSQG